MAQWLRANTTSTTIIGPFVDKTDGASAYTAIEVSSATIIDIYKGGTKTDVTTTSAGANTMAHVAGGWYSLVISSTQVDTVGPFTIVGNVASCLTVWARYMVIKEDAYDGMVALTTALWAQASAVAAVKVDTASSLVWLASSYIGITSTITTVNSISSAMVAVNAKVSSSLLMMASSLVYHASSLAYLASSLVYQASSLVWMASALAKIDTIDTVVDTIKVDTASSVTYLASALTYQASSLVWLASVNTNVKAITPGDPAAIADAVWDEMIVDHTTSGSTGEKLNAAAAAGDPWTTNLPGAYSGIQAGNMLSTISLGMASSLVYHASSLAYLASALVYQASSLAWHASALAKIDTIDTVVDTIKVDTASSVTYLASALTYQASSLVWLASCRTYLASALTYQASSLVWHASALAKIDTLTTTVTTVKVDTASSLVYLTSALTYQASSLVWLASALTKIDTLTTTVDTVKVDTASSLVWLASAHTHISSLNDISAADVNAQVLDVLNVDTFAEPGQEAPAATNTIVKKIGYLFKLLRNKITNDGTTISVYNDDAATVDQKATVSEAAGTVTRDEFGSGP